MAKYTKTHEDGKCLLITYNEEGTEHTLLRFAGILRTVFSGVAPAMKTTKKLSLYVYRPWQGSVRDREYFLS